MSFARSMIPLTMFLALSRLNLFVYGVSQSENDTIPSSSEEEDSYSNRRLGGGRHDNNDRRQRSLYNLGTTGIRSGTRTSSHSSHSNVDQQSSTVGTERNYHDDHFLWDDYWNVDDPYTGDDYVVGHDDNYYHKTQKNEHGTEGGKNTKKTGRGGQGKGGNGKGGNGNVNYYDDYHPGIDDFFGGLDDDHYYYGNGKGKGKGKGGKNAKACKEGKGKGGKGSKGGKAAKKDCLYYDDYYPSDDNQFDDFFFDDDFFIFEPRPTVTISGEAFSYQTSISPVVPNTLTPNTLDIGTVYLYSNWTNDVSDVSQSEIPVFADGEEVLLWIALDGYCTRIAVVDPAEARDDTPQAYCHFTYTIYDPETLVVAGGFVAQGFLVDATFPGQFLATGGFGLLAGVTGLVEITPASLDTNMTPPLVVSATPGSDVFDQAEGYLHNFLLQADVFFFLPNLYQNQR